MRVAVSANDLAPDPSFEAAWQAWVARYARSGSRGSSKSLVRARRQARLCIPKELRWEVGGGPRRRFAKRARGGDPRLSGAKERSWGLRPSERSAGEDPLRRTGDARSCEAGDRRHSKRGEICLTHPFAPPKFNGLSY